MTSSIFFLSDYGRKDEFVGVVHAVVRRYAPETVVIDLTHEIEPFDVVGGARALVRSIPYLGDGVVLAVVDPGVGGSRRGLALEVCPRLCDTEYSGPEYSGPRYFVGPDNGLLIESAERLGRICRAFSLTPNQAEVRAQKSRSQSRDRFSTFDGRDVFAPVAAALSNGTELDILGEPIEIESLVRLRGVPRVERVQGWDSDGRVREVARCEVAWVDRFGNVQLTAELGDLMAGSKGTLFDIEADDVERVERFEQFERFQQFERFEEFEKFERFEVAIQPFQAVGKLDSGTVDAEIFRFDISARWVKTYGDLNENELGLISDANGHLALVLREGSAAVHLGVKVGTTIDIAI